MLYYSLLYNFIKSLTILFVTTNIKNEPILSQCSISIPPEKIVFLTYSGDIEIEYWV